MKIRYIVYRDKNTGQPWKYWYYGFYTRKTEAFRIATELAKEENVKWKIHEMERETILGQPERGYMLFTRGLKPLLT